MCIHMSVKDKIEDTNTIQRVFDLDDDLYTRIENIAESKYHKSVSAIINACILELAETEDVKLYKNQNEFLVKHSVILRKKTLDELYRLKDIYKVPIYRLINIAMRNAIDELEN